MEKYKVLIVEDAIVDANFIKNALSSEIFELLILNRGTGFMSEVEKFNPDIIILDLNLPDINGVDLCRQLKAKKGCCHIPVIIETSEQDIHVLEAAYKAGAWDYIKKPFNSMELLIRMENMLRMSNNVRNLIQIKQDNTVSEMGRSIAHNFNQPLTSLLGAGDILLNYSENGALDPRTEDLVRTMVESAKKISSLVEKVERLKEYKIKDYIQDVKIIDLDQE